MTQESINGEPLRMAISSLVSAHQLIDGLQRDMIDEGGSWIALPTPKDILLDALDTLDDLISTLEDLSL